MYVILKNIQIFYINNSFFVINFMSIEKVCDIDAYFENIC